MNPKASTILEKACEERRRSNFKKAIDRLEEGVQKFPGEFSLYTEAIDVGMEAGESLRAIQIFKKAQHKFPDHAFEVWTFAAEKVGTYNDSIMGRFLVEQAVKTGDLAAAASILDNLKDHAVSDLLERIRIKKQTMSVAHGSGSSGRGEIALFTLTEALLSLRIGRMQAAMDEFVAAIAEDPALAKRIEPFLADFENRSEGKAETAFALGCCLFEHGDFPQGLAKLSQAARTEPTLAPRVIERIESLGGTPDLPLDLHDLTLAQLYLGRGDKQRAARILKGTIERTPGRAADAVDLLRGSVEAVDEDLETQFVFVEAAFASGRRETALGQLRKIYKDKRHTTRLVEWLESRTQSQSGSTEVQLFFAETALREGLCAKAIEIFKEILSRGPQENAIIRELLSQHQSVPVVRAFYNSKFAAARDKAKGKAGAFELERYDRGGFRPRETGSAVEKDPSPGQSDDGPEPAGSAPFQGAESLFRQAATGARARGEALPSDFDNHDFSLTMHEPGAPAGAPPAPAAAAVPAVPTGDHAAPMAQVAPAEPARDVPVPAAPTAPAREGPNGSAPADDAFAMADPPAKNPEAGTSDRDNADGSDFFEYLKRHSRGAETAPTDTSLPARAPAAPATSQGAHAVVESSAAEPVAEPAAGVSREDELSSREEPLFAGDDSVANETATGDETAGDASREEDAVPEEEEYRDFDSLYRAALDGRLDHARMIEAAGLALDEGKMDEMKRLLLFDPANLGEDIARKYHLARYYLEKDQPLPALVALRTVHLNSLSREERRDFMLRIAESYRGLHNFEAAHGVYLRIMTENPGLSDVEALARANYARYVETETGSAAALEKTTTL